MGMSDRMIWFIFLLIPFHKTNSLEEMFRYSQKIYILIKKRKAFGLISNRIYISEFEFVILFDLQHIYFKA